MTIMRHWVIVIATLLGVVLCAASAEAQVDPRGRLRTIHTPHLRVHVAAHEEALGRRAAAIGERAYAQLARELATPAGPIDMVIADNVDFSNGFAQVFPTNRVVIYAVPPVGSTELRFHDDWLTLVITHELAHIFHIDRARGMWRAGRWLFGRNPLFFPNAFTPSWVKEGLAVHYESSLTGSGRLVSTESRTVARTAARDDVLPPIGRWSLATSRFPLGQTAYGYGALLMDQSARAGGDSSMRRYVDEIAEFPIPMLLGRASSAAFGVAFTAQYARMRDSLQRAAAGLDTSGDLAWRAVTTDGWNAEAPRWRSVDSVIWVASNGRDVTGLFTADVRTPTPKATRLARRNGLDVNAPRDSAGTVFAQIDYRNPYELRSDLYIGRGTAETRLTRGARLTQPDVRADGAIVAIQLKAAGAQLVRVDTAGAVRVLQAENSWADPRWSADGTRMVAVEFLPTGEQRIVVMDSLGVVQQVVSGTRAVMASPSFTPDGRRLVWSSDRSGTMQLETSPVQPASAARDTLSWRADASGQSRHVRAASRVSSGVYAPTVSPDGQLVAALVYREDGFVVSVAALDTTGPPVENRWYAAQGALPPIATGVAANDSASRVTPYRPLRQLLPRYWLPQIGTGRLGQATYGASSSGSDILGRHEWSATATRDLSGGASRGETDGVAIYRYRGFGVPVFDLSWAQSWDATFRVTDTAGAIRGDIARRRRFATLSSNWSRPRIRSSWSGTFGAQYEMRDFFSDVDALLRDPTVLARPRTRYPSVFANVGLSTVRLGSRGITIEEGITASMASSYRWREDAPTLNAWRHIGVMRGYLPLPLPGFARHVLAARVSAGGTGKNAQTELNAGGVSGVASELLPGVVFGDPGRSFPVRGIEPAAQRGTRALGATVEYRAPLWWFRTAPSPFTLFLDRMSLTVFNDVARAWCPGAVARASRTLCERPGDRDGWMASAGAEVVFDMAVQYDAPYRLRVGVAAPYASPAGVPRAQNVYITLGSLF
ncbi:MAG: PD40 domain-containing protein [Gemmatimonadaceae bacterium]|nr:PD40 domain-containing protein [Gemmatimonadaceae bacterium]